MLGRPAKTVQVEAAGQAVRQLAHLAGVAALARLHHAGQRGTARGQKGRQRRAQVGVDQDRVDRQGRGRGGSRRAGGGALQGLPQLFARDRARQVQVAAGGQAAAARLDVVVRGHGHDQAGRPSQFMLDLAQAHGGVKAVHERHFQVHQDHVGALGQHRLDRVAAVVGRAHPQRRAGQVAPHHQQIEFVVVDQQHVVRRQLAGRQRGRCGGMFGRGGRRRSRVQAHADGGAVARARDHLDIAFLHARHQAGRIGAQAGATLLAGAGVLFKKALAQHLRHGCAVVNFQQHGGARTHRQADAFAFMRGLDGVLKQVGDHRIAQQLFGPHPDPGAGGRRLAVDLQIKAQAARIGRTGQVKQHRAQHRQQVDRLRAKAVAAALHLEQVERQVHHAQHAVAGALDDGQHLGILGQQAALFAQQARNADDARERGLEVVAADALDFLAQARVLEQGVVLAFELGRLGRHFGLGQHQRQLVAHARLDDGGRERLGDVVDGADGQAHRLVRFGVGAGDEDDGDVAAGRVGLEAAARLVAIHAGHEHVEQHQRRTLARHLFQRFEAVAREHDLAERTQQGAQQAYVLHHIIDNQNDGQHMFLLAVDPATTIIVLPINYTGVAPAAASPRGEVR